ncbi:MAG: phosphatidylglycerol lysyltransferase domain-containing protein, partial [Acidimicrobiales bacterium]
PLFAAVGEPGPYLERGMHSWTIAEDPVIHLADFGLGGSRMAGVRHSVSAALRSGLRITSLTEKYFCGAAEVSRLWLQKKRGAEMGFTLGRFIPSELEGVDCQVALDAEDRVVAFVTWRSYANGSGRVLDLMRRSAHAPNPTMDLLVADGLGRFAQAGVDEASLGSVPVAHGRLGERFYPTRSLRRYKDKFAPEWQPRYLVTPSRPSLPGALAALGRSYCPGGLARAIRRND